MEILRKLICQESTTFKNVWTTHSTSPIAYQSGKIYFDNYRCCVSCVTPEPRIIYQMPPCSKSEKIEDALLLECPVGEVLPCPSDYKPSLAVLTAHNWLFRLSASSGEILEKVYLTSACKFRYLSWDTPQEIMVVKSAQCKVLAAARQAGIQQSVLFFLAVFRVLPLSFIGMLEIDKKIFGNSITDATLSHSMLIVMHSVGLVRLYSFQSISEKFMTKQVDLGHECNWNGKVGVVGKYPFGIPCNIKITDTPDLLLRCLPWRDTHFRLEDTLGITSSLLTRKAKGIFHVCSLKRPHFDSSGRILHVGPNLIKILKLMKTNSVTEPQAIKDDFIIEGPQENDVNNWVAVTASGRK
uniref:Uncharacterized protein n=1 Tax=Sphaerodactylus townsendi TaxID=933632 RepID=A0ACB8G1L2_9SAUR